MSVYACVYDYVCMHMRTQVICVHAYMYVACLYECVCMYGCVLMHVHTQAMFVSVCACVYCTSMLPVCVSVWMNVHECVHMPESL